MANTVKTSLGAPHEAPQLAAVQPLKSPIEQIVDHVFNELSNVDDTINALESRLLKILGPDIPMPSDALGEMEGNCQHEAHLLGHYGRIKLINARLNILIERLRL
jgi:hypothetical protein